MLICGPPTRKSRPLIEVSAPWNSTTLAVALPLSDSPRNVHAFCPYARLSARTTMNTLPLSGRVSTLTTGIFFCARLSSVDAMAAVSCGAITIALAPRPTSVWVLATRFWMSFWELVGGSRLTPRSLALVGTYPL